MLFGCEHDLVELLSWNVCTLRMECMYIEDSYLGNIVYDKSHISFLFFRGNAFIRSVENTNSASW